jgi:glycosyltransferase involved in cell wall biosynthesis
MNQNPTPRIPISLCLITKNEAKNITPFWRSIKPLLTHPDDEVVMVDTGSTDATIKEAMRRKWKVISRPDLCSLDISKLGKKWKPEFYDKYSKHPHFNNGILRSFAEARQIGFDAAKNEVCMWIDLDDNILNPQYLRGIIDNVSLNPSRPKNHGFTIFLRYDYSFKENGECNTVLWRERIVTKSDFEWKGACHETLIPREGRDYIMARDPECPVVIQHRAPKAHEFSDLRNYIIMRKDLEIDKHYDPRTLFYIANASRGLKCHKEALNWYNSFISRSGSRDDIMSARLNMAYCWSRMGNPWRGLKECTEAQLVDYQDPRPFYTAAALWGELQHWENVITNVMLGDQLQLRDTLHAIDPTTLHFHPALLLTQAHRELNHPEIALKAAERLLQSGPNDEYIKGLVEDTRAWAQAEMSSGAIMTALHAAKDPQEALKHFNISPHMLDRGLPSPESESPGDKNKPTVAFFCGQSATRWGPPSVEKGVGASEKMVYEAAKRLVKRGFNVQVYCRLNRPEGVCDEGIHWYYSGRFDPMIYREYVIIWRMPQLLKQMSIECGKLFIWMHDVGDNSVWTQAIQDKIDKVFFLSDFHRSLHPALPDNKVYRTRNGIDITQHIYDETPKKKKIIFFSSPDRGWLRAISVFNTSGLYEQGYELHMFYGFGELWRKLAAEQGWGHVVELKADKRLYEYEDECKMLAEETPGVIYRGSVGWKDMAKELMDSEIWLYPTNFDEISCVAAMEAMAAGLKVVATDHAALKETLKGYPAWFKAAPDPGMAHNALLEAANTPANPTKAAEFAKKFDMDIVIDEWVNDLMEENKNGSDFRPSSDRGNPKDGEKRFGFYNPYRRCN